MNSEAKTGGSVLEQLREKLRRASLMCEPLRCCISRNSSLLADQTGMPPAALWFETETLCVQTCMDSSLQLFCILIVHISL